jgi:serine/threonine protein kinase
VGHPLAADPGPLPETLQRALAPGGATEPRLEPPTLPPSRFQRIRPLGSGGFGTVWLALDTALGRTVAVKAARAPDAATEHRIRREARALAAVHHPHCVQIYDILNDADGDLVIIMEHVPGRSLSAAVEADGPLPDHAGARLWITLAGALHAAHGKGVLHRDVKPSNVIIDEDGFPHLIDFGIARTSRDVTITAAGMVIGTPDYLAPEVAAGKPASPVSDAWQLAATVSYALAGRPPRAHRDGAVAALLAAAQGQPCTQLPVLSAHHELLERALHPDPARRLDLPQVQAELGRRLAAIGQPAEGPVTERMPRPPTPAAPARAPAWPTEEPP